MPRRRWPCAETLQGRSAGITNVKRLIERVAGTDVNVLILGESGTGKELVARSLHRKSKCAGGNFVPINCGAIPAELLESELFGHEKGAFTGAVSSRAGRFELAEGGTLFLDEIGDMSPGMQVKLLRVLETRCYERVGGNDTRSANVRIVAATHRDLEARIETGQFRQDLYYRLNVFPIHVPPLRERLEDIALIAGSTIDRLRAERGGFSFSDEAICALQRYQWPGNVRELCNLIERLRILCPEAVVGVADLPEKIVNSLPEALGVAPQTTPSSAQAIGAEETVRLPAQGIDLKTYLETTERHLIAQALEEADGVVAHAAKRLKVRRTTLVDKLRKYDLHRESANEPLDVESA